MPKRPDAYYRPEDIAAAWQLVQQPDVALLGGGTKLLAGNITEAVVDLQALGLNSLRQRNGVLRVGAMVRLTDMAQFLAEDGVDVSFSALVQQAIQQAGPNTYRHAATLGGSVGARLVDSELLAALLVLDAQLALYHGETTMVSLAAYLAGEERPFGIITHLDIPLEAGRGQAERVARTPADYPIVSITGWQPTHGVVRLAATGIDKRPLRLPFAETAVATGLTADSIEAAAAATKAACSHPGDFRGDVSYRAEMATVLTRRVLNQLR